MSEASYNVAYHLKCYDDVPDNMFLEVMEEFFCQCNNPLPSASGKDCLQCEKCISSELEKACCCRVLNPCPECQRLKLSDVHVVDYNHGVDRYRRLKKEEGEQCGNRNMSTVPSRTYLVRFLGDPVPSPAEDDDSEEEHILYMTEDELKKRIQTYSKQRREQEEEEEKRNKDVIL